MAVGREEMRRITKHDFVCVGLLARTIECCLTIPDYVIQCSMLKQTSSLDFSMHKLPLDPIKVIQWISHMNLNMKSTQQHAKVEVRLNPFPPRPLQFPLLQAFLHRNDGANYKTSPSPIFSHSPALAVENLIRTDPKLCNLVDGDSRLPIHWAVSYSHLPVVSLLLSRADFDPDIQDGSGWTPLMIASSLKEGQEQHDGADEIVDLLLNKGADVNIKSQFPLFRPPFFFLSTLV